MTPWEKFFDEKIKKIAKEKVIFDIGGCSGFQKGLKPYKKYFLNCNYKTIDINPNCHPDILADVHNLPISDNFADGVICISVLEHVKYPFRAVDEIYRILKSSGKCIFYLPFLQAYHGKDYWRFSEDGIRYMFRKFRKIETCSVMGHFETIFHLFPFQNKFPINMLRGLARALDRISGKKQSNKQVCGYSIFLVK